jgi:hypothetical protein
VVGENNYCAAKEDADSCDKSMRPALEQECTARLLVCVVPICTDSATSGECLHYDNIYV